MKHTLFRRHSGLALCSLLILTVMCAPLAFAAGAAAANPVTLTGASGLGNVLAGGAVLFALGTLDPASTDEGDKPVAVADAIAAIEDKTLPIGQRLSVAMQALKGVDPTGQLATVKGEYDRAMADLATAREQLTAVNTELADLKLQLAAREADVKAADGARAAAEKTVADLQAKEQDLDKRADSKMKEKLAALGISSDKTPPQGGKVQDQMEEQGKPEARIRELKGSKRVEAALHFKSTGKLPEWMNN